MNTVLAIVGPTATGKSETAIFLARSLDGEIVNADSRQVYRFMDIGTAKPTAEQRSLVRHYLVDVVDPDEDFSLALYQDLAYRAIRDIHGRGKLAILVGGTGLYVWSVLEGWRIPPVPAAKELRDKLEQRARGGQAHMLYNELLEVDPESAMAIGTTNTRRIVRALEVFLVTGKPASSLKAKQPPGFTSCIIGLTANRADLYIRIDERVDRMVSSGLIEETRSLLDRGYSLDLRSMSGIGYREIGLFLKGQLDLNTAIARIKNNTHNFARHQYAWFRLADQRIRWFDTDIAGRPEIMRHAELYVHRSHNQCCATA
ncbi:MAG: tRNA (adenosine(37)-N6)-dimethylallyltransferase MiaA [Chloroflexi bacterium]|nr:tRNA (adenosine(37)-N6)-dimethylallyltransferase MiaA [Chloroflexota bacterium]